MRIKGIILILEISIIGILADFDIIRRSHSGIIFNFNIRFLKMIQLNVYINIVDLPLTYCLTYKK